MLHQQQQNHKQHAHNTTQNQHYVSNIPTPKKILFPGTISYVNSNQNTECLSEENNTNLNENFNSIFSINHIQVPTRLKTSNHQNNMNNFVSSESTSSGENIIYMK